MRNVIEVYGRVVPGLKWGEFHTHSNKSDGRIPPEMIVLEAEQEGLDFLAVTDHSTLEGSDIAYNYAERTNSPVTVIPGCMEVRTDGGLHVVIYEAQSLLNDNLSMEELLRQAHRQGAKAAFAHPFGETDRFPDHTIMGTVVYGYDPGAQLDAWELENTGLRNRERKGNGDSNHKAFQYYQDHPGRLGAAWGSTDMHLPPIGVTRVGVKGDWRTAMDRHETVVVRLTDSEKRDALAHSLERIGPNNFNMGDLKEMYEILSQGEQDGRQ